MHDKLSEILGVEVVGEVVQVGNAFFDVGLGRVCLEQLEREAVEPLLALLRAHYRNDIEVTDSLHLTDSAAPMRGFVEVGIRDPDMGDLYLLQITSHTIVAFYERRFVLTPGLLGDVMGTFYRGFSNLFAQGEEGPLRILSAYPEVLESYLAHLDAAVRAAIDGQSVDAAASVADMSRLLRRVWKLTPWTLKSRIEPLSRTPRDRIVRHDPVMRRTVIFARSALDGAPVYEYSHQHNPLEEYDQVLGWMTDIHQAVVETYPSPRYSAAMARASSVDTFIRCFPGHDTLVGRVREEELEPPA